MAKYLEKMLPQLDIPVIIRQIHCQFYSYMAALFVAGLAFSYCFVDYTVSSVLIDYLTENWTTENLPKAAAIVNIQDGLSSIMTFVIVHICDDRCISRFTTVACATFVYLMGLVMLWLSTSLVSLENHKLQIFYVAGLLIALGQAGQEPTLKSFLADQISLLVQGSKIDKERLEKRTTLWWRITRLLAAAIALIYNFSSHSWARNSQISAIVMGAAYFVFWAGFYIYYCRIPAGSPLTLIYNVVKAAFLKRKLQFPQMASQFFKNYINELPLPPRIRILRGLDKAAIMESSYPEDEVKKGKLCTVNQVSQVKMLFKMIPMWTTVLVYSLVQATGNTFFFSQSYDLNNRMGSLRVPINALSMIKSLSSNLLSYICDYHVPKQWSDATRKNFTLVRIFLGMACSFLCCITAMMVEDRRLQLISTLDDQSQTIAMSIFWLTPQFILLGAMEGLTQDGVNTFLYDHIAPSQDRYGAPFEQFVVGIGKFASTLCILVFRNFFGDTINTSRLDWYYFALAMINVFYLCFNLYLFTLYGDFKEAPGKDIELHEISSVADGGGLSVLVVTNDHPLESYS